MKAAPFLRLVRQNLRRNFRHFVFSAFGIVVGIAAFVFFLGLSGGVRTVVLGDIFPIDRVEVIPPKTTLTGMPVILDADVVDRVKARPEVAGVYPKLKLSFPARGRGKLFGFDIRCFELGGFTDGIDPALVAGDPGADMFKDWEAEPEELEWCRPATEEQRCPDLYYCAHDGKCHHRVPVLVNRTMIELYNGSFAQAHNLPRIGSAQEALLKSNLRKLVFEMALGDSCLPMSTHVKAPVEYMEAMPVGISSKAIPIGMTVPIGYIKRWNEKFVGEEASRQFSSILVTVKDKDDVASFVSWVRQSGYDTEESYAERFALVITIVTFLFLLISFVIVGLSAVNISHTFFMIISERKREIGILRTVGASRRDVRNIIMAEAGFIGLLAGGFGVLVGFGAAKLIDFISARFVPDFPFKPETYFQFTPLLLAGALLFAIGFCVFGAYLPARRAARIQPAAALTN